jgi:hypothetical protein
MKNMFENRDCVGILPESVWAPPFVTIVTYRNTFEVVFPTSEGKARDDAIATFEDNSRTLFYLSKIRKLTLSHLL